jgi:hydrogenase expression/formation protein HypD
MSGLGLRDEFAAWDAERKFDLADIRATEPEECRAGDVLRGRIKPVECSAFGTACTPETPLGAPMVSSEGACAAYWAFARYRGAGTGAGA